MLLLTNSTWQSRAAFDKMRQDTIIEYAINIHMMYGIELQLHIQLFIIIII